MTTKPDLIKWVTDDSSSKITDPGATKKLQGWIYKEKPAFQFFNWLFNRIHKWLLGTQGNFYDIVIGSSAQVTALEATHTISNLNNTLAVSGSKILLLEGTHVLGAALSLSNNNLTIHSENPAAILDVATYTATFSGANNDIKLATANVGSGDVVVSGAGSVFEGYNLDIANVSVSNGAIAITSGTTGGVKNASFLGNLIGTFAGNASSFYLNSTNQNAGTLPDARLSTNVLTKTNAPLDSSFITNNNITNTTVTSAQTEVVDLDLGTVSVGDKFLISVLLHVTKGATAGKTEFTVVKKSGTGLQIFMPGNGSTWYVDDKDPQSANAVQYITATTLFRVTTAGTLILKLQGSSSGSDATVTQFQGKLAVQQIYNA